MRRRDAGGCEVGAFTVYGMVEMLGEGIVDDTDERFKFVGECKGDGDVRMCVDEVGRSVYWVDYEGRGGGEAAGG